MDKHRKAKQQQHDGDPGGLDADRDADEVRRALYTIDMTASSSSTAARRSSRSASHGAARAESWMTRVSTAMSHRIFIGSGGGKKLCGSRSTQVMPMQLAGSQDLGSDTSNTAPNGGDAAGLAASSSENSFLAPASGKQPASAASSTAIVGFGDAVDGDTNLEASPSVACDAESSDDEEDAGRRRQPQDQSVARSRSRRRGERTEWVSKVAPTRGAAVFDDDDDDGGRGNENSSRRIGSVPVHVRVLTTSVSPQRHRQHRDHEEDEDEDEEGSAATSTPMVLKDFFSRTPSVGVEIRDQQRRARREAHYRRIRERQDKLRDRLEREDPRPEKVEEATSDSDRRRLKAQQLRRLNVARRLELRREAAVARDQVLTRVREQDERAFSSAREHWEREFQNEIRALSDAFRRARARNHCTRSENDTGGEEIGRPMTIAGLAVPEAVSEIHRGLSNFDKRVKSAGDSPSPTCLKAADARVPRQSVSKESSGPNDRPKDELQALADAVNADNDEEDEEQQEEVLEVLLEVAGDMEGVVIDVGALLGERERLLQRVTDIDRLVDVQRRLGLASDL